MTDREKFEAYMRGLNACTRMKRQSEAVGGKYQTISVQRAWELWQASRKQMAEEAAAVCEDYASRAKSTGEMFHQGTERRVGWEAKQEAGKTLSVRFKALCRSLATQEAK